MFYNDNTLSVVQYTISHCKIRLELWDTIYNRMGASCEMKMKLKTKLI